MNDNTEIDTLFPPTPPVAPGTPVFNVFDPVESAGFTTMQRARAAHFEGAAHAAAGHSMVSDHERPPHWAAYVRAAYQKGFNGEPLITPPVKK
jgi:hypothetical protein